MDIDLTNKSVQIYIITVDGKKYIVYLNYVGTDVEVMVEDVETKERACSKESTEESTISGKQAAEKAVRISIKKLINHRNPNDTDTP
ncbi:hypothetical protein [Salicibibacter kimchii]|uniref:Uncharacterized protein n=1 Tax=Salicibibacter kimchii TaxID=2099786 RepID=A0A345C297_9BACI|nr:hypothetical protein [Salicibibacter kimchii]AXF57328.1 hypothetical protein DT065_15850 [Salicibibacter kimchii]